MDPLRAWVFLCPFRDAGHADELHLPRRHPDGPFPSDGDHPGLVPPRAAIEAIDAGVGEIWIVGDYLLADQLERHPQESLGARLPEGAQKRRRQGRREDDRRIFWKKKGEHRSRQCVERCSPKNE